MILFFSLTLLKLNFHFCSKLSQELILNLLSVTQSCYQPKIDRIKRNLNHLKEFIMQEFISQQQLSDAEA